MKKYSVIFILLFGLFSVAAYRSYRNDDVVVGTLAVGTSAISSVTALFEVSSTSQGWLPPRLTTTQQNNIATPPNGLSIFNSTLNYPTFYNGAWRQVCTLNGSEAFTNKTIVPSSNSISLTTGSVLIGTAGVATERAITGDVALTNLGVTSYSTTVPLSKGGTGQTTKAAAFDALSPMTTAGDIIIGGASGTGTRKAIGTEAQILKVVSGVPTWADATVASSSDSLVTKTANYVITGGEGTIVYDTSTGGSMNATLPTAVGRQGEIFRIVKRGTSSNTVTLLTTSSQTVGDRASGSIILRRYGDYVEVQSNGSNYEILSKREFEYVSATSSAFSISTLTAGNYADMTGNSITITPGFWEVNGGFHANLGSGSGINIQATTGLFGANGNDTTSPPTAVGGTVVSGPQSYSTMIGISPLWMTFSGASSRFLIPPLRIYISVSSNTDIYFVPNIDYSVAGTATITAWLTGRRIY